jgi:hypothetical protein
MGMRTPVPLARAYPALGDSVDLSRMSVLAALSEAQPAPASEPSTQASASETDEKGEVNVASDTDEESEVVAVISDADEKDEVVAVGGSKTDELSEVAAVGGSETDELSEVVAVGGSETDEISGVLAVGGSETDGKGEVAEPTSTPSAEVPDSALSGEPVNVPHEQMQRQVSVLKSGSVCAIELVCVVTSDQESAMASGHELASKSEQSEERDECIDDISESATLDWSFLDQHCRPGSAQTHRRTPECTRVHMHMHTHTRATNTPLLQV